MTTRIALVEKTLHWRQPEAWKRAYELRSEKAVVGLLRFPAWHRFDATGRIFDDEWQFVRKGFLTQRVEVLGGSASTKVAEFTERFPGGSGGVAMANGRILEFSNNFLLTDWRLSDGREVPLVRCHHAGGFLHSSATVDIRRDSAILDAEPWLLLLGWYLLILKHGDSV